MAKKYLDYDGLLYFWQKIKTTFALASHNHTKSQITDFPTEMTPSSHTHGNIQNGGTLQTTDVGVANGDKLVITDASSSNKVARSSVVFDGSTENKALTPKGTWKEFNNYVHPTTTAQSASAKKVGNDANGHVVLGDALKTSDLTNDSGFITIEDVPAGVQPTTTSPKMDGTASVGSETKYAKGDHVHPSDTSRVPTTRKVNGKALSADITLGASDIKMTDDNDVESEILQRFEATSMTGDLTTGNEIGISYKLNDTTYGETIYDKNRIDYLFGLAGTALNGKVDKVDGKGLSTNDYTDAEKTKLGKLVFDGSDKIDSSILPSYVDDVIEAYARSGQTALSATWLATGSASGTVITPETGKIYVLMADSGDYTANTQFRWSGTTYVKLADGGVSSITNAEIDTILAS